MRVDLSNLAVISLSISKGKSVSFAIFLDTLSMQYLVISIKECINADERCYNVYMYLMILSLVLHSQGSGAVPTTHA